jgi:hypothetical protein
VLQAVPGMNKWFDKGTSMDRYFINQILQNGSGFFINEALYHVNVRPNSNHKQFSYKKLTSLHLCEELVRQMAVEKTDWLSTGNFVAIEAFEQGILADKKKMSEAYRATAVFDIEFGNYRPALKGLLQSLRFHVGGQNLRTFFYLLRSVAGIKKAST